MLWFIRNARREAAQQLLTELFNYNGRDDCFDPVGSFDATGIRAAIEVIAQGRLDTRNWKANLSRLKPMKLVRQPRLYARKLA